MVRPEESHNFKRTVAFEHKWEYLQQLIHFSLKWLSDESLQRLAQAQHAFSTMASHSETPPICCLLKLYFLTCEKQRFTVHFTQNILNGIFFFPENLNCGFFIYSTMYFHKWLPTFWSSLLPSSSG